MRLILGGGGTGGHLFPGLAVAEELKRREPYSEILFVVERGNKLTGFLEKAGFGCKSILTKPFAGKSVFNKLYSVFISFAGLVESILIIRVFNPDIVVGLGGYVSGPLILAAVLLRKRTAIQEQNYIPGLVTKILSRFVNEVELAFRETAGSLRFKNVAVTGTPVRGSIFCIDRATSAKELALDEKKVTVLILGGSLGAHRLNLAVLNAFQAVEEELRQGLQVIHITGKKDFSMVKRAYISTGISAFVIPFTENMQYVYGLADLAISRAGGSAIAEITACGLPAIYVPYPWATDNHQEYNARWVCERGGGELIPEQELDKRLTESIKSFLKDRRKILSVSEASKRLGKPEATGLVVDRLMTLKTGV